MKINQWRFFAEIVGITAVVLSLVALILEIAQARSAIEAATYQGRAFEAMGSIEDLMESEVMLPILMRVDPTDPNTFDAFTEVERERIRLYYVAQRIDADNEYYQYERGFLDNDYYENSLVPSIRRDAPVWRSMGIGENRQAFRHFVDMLIGE